MVSVCTYAPLNYSLTMHITETLLHCFKPCVFWGFELFLVVLFVCFFKPEALTKSSGSDWIYGFTVLIK